jgi:hypothetical protein
MARRSDDERPPLAPPAAVSISDRGVLDDDAPGRTVEVCVRSLSEEAQPLLDDTLRRLRASDEVQEVSVVVWGRSFDPTGPAAATGTGRALADRLETFREWAAVNGVSFGPFFSAHTVERLTGGAYTRVELPTVTLAEYRDDELAFVSPCWMGDRYHGVLDRVGDVEAGTAGPATAVEPTDSFESTGGHGASIRT